ncbi:histone demethylase [Pichia kluyveri]|uniref:Histone demethylase n=1 Tax=Pichia kluyveri TaxID=36015 RepID=A0AAV5R7S4_PICKL|nr:histone demethylase [Pichia kluyveri]
MSMGNISKIGKLGQVPELHPTNEEFKHPIKYLSKPENIKLGENFGILKVVPPKGWEPRFSLDWDSFKFHTRIQKLHELNLRNRSRACFVEGFNCFLTSKGIDPFPVDDDLCLGVSNDYKLSKYDLDSHLNGWFRTNDGGKVHIHDIFISKETRKWFYKIMDDDRDLLKKLSLYCKYLSQTLRLNDNHGDEKEKKKFDDSVLPPEVSHKTLQKLLISPAALLVQPQNFKKLERMKTRISNTRMKNAESSNKRRKLHDTLNTQLLTPPTEKPSTFENSQFSTPINNIPSSDPITPPDIISPESLDETCVICFSAHSPERTLICDGCSRGFHMDCLSYRLDKVPKFDWFCNECLVGSTSVYADYGFEEEFANKFSLNEFSKYCKEWENEFYNYLRNHNLIDKLQLEVIEDGKGNHKFSEVSVEKLFWHLTNGTIRIPKSSKLKIRYGADINSKVPGELSGFPNKDSISNNNEDDKYIDDEWNLTKLPFAKGSLLEYVCKSLNDETGSEVESSEVKPEGISGMSIPWIYVGGPLSTFCWHKEDHYTLSANYSHLGAPKKWYGIANKDCEKFDKIINNIAPEYEAKQRDLMHQLVSMISPNELNELDDTDKIPIYETIQRPGEFIITFPKVYHSGFNYGFNVNEAVNFTLPLWIPYSTTAIKDYEKVGKECVFDTFKLLKKIYIDLQDEQCQREWMEDTGITFDQIGELVEWVKNQYNEEIAKFQEIYKDEEFSELLNKVEKVKIVDYLKERKIIKKEDNKIKEEEDEEEDEELEDRVCCDCKTRVHFQWMVVDIYKDCMKGRKIVVKEVNKQEEQKELKTEFELEIKTDNNYRDKESEWEAIIREARESGKAETDEGHTRKRRSSRRKREETIEINEDKDDNGNDDRAKEQVYSALELLHNENNAFGQCVFCMGCFSKELQNLNASEKERVISVSRLVGE